MRQQLVNVDVEKRRAPLLRARGIEKGSMENLQEPRLERRERPQTRPSTPGSDRSFLDEILSGGRVPRQQSSSPVKRIEVQADALEWARQRLGSTPPVFGEDDDLGRAGRHI